MRARPPERGRAGKPYSIDEPPHTETDTMNVKITWPMLCATLCVAMSCTTSTPTPDAPATEAPEAARAPIQTPLLSPEDASAIEAVRVAEIGGLEDVFFYLSPDGVAVDGKDALVVDEQTRRFREEDRKGGPDGLYLEALMPALKAASEARPFPADSTLRARLVSNVFVEPATPARMLVELAYTIGQGLHPTVEDQEDRYVVLGDVGGPLMKFASRHDGSWRVVNLVGQSLAVGPGEEPSSELVMSASSRGVRVAVNGALLPPIEGCPADGPTVCNKGGANASELAARVSSTSGAERDAALAELVALYDTRRLYNTALKIKADHPSETVFTVAVDSDLPIALLDEVIHAVRYVRVSDSADHSFTDDAAFDSAPTNMERFTVDAFPDETMERVDDLFADPILGLAM